MAEFPIGTQVEVEKFDRWAHKHGYLNLPEGAPKQSDVWLAHLQRRHQLRYNLNKAATHPRMTDMGAQPFTIDTIGQGLLEVRAPHTAIGKNELASKIASLVGTKRRQLRYLMQSTNWTLLPPHERAIAETLHDDINMFKEMINVQANGLNAKFAKIQQKFKLVEPKALADGLGEDDIDE